VILGGRRNRFFTFRNGEAVVNAVRFATAFFGKGQFEAAQIEESGNGWRLTQSLEGPYYQPLDPPRNVSADEWETSRMNRRRTEISKLTQSVTITPGEKAFRVRVQAIGQSDVPLSLEINFREGGRFEGTLEEVPNTPDAYLLGTGTAIYRAGEYGIRFGPGANGHLWTQVRGAAAKLSGPGVYLTGFTPFDHTVAFECVKY
jgi:hypothetical protein